MEYRFQVDEIKTKTDEKKITKLFKDWTGQGEGYNIKSKFNISIFSKKFTDEGEAIKWVKKNIIFTTKLDKSSIKPRYINLVEGKKDEPSKKRSTKGGAVSKSDKKENK